MDSHKVAEAKKAPTPSEALIKITNTPPPKLYKPLTSESATTLHKKLTSGKVYTKTPSIKRLAPLNYLDNLYKSLEINNPPNKEDIFTGGCFKVIQDIKEESSGVTGLWGYLPSITGERSELRINLKKELQITQFSLDVDKEQAVCLHALSKYEADDFKHTPEQKKQLTQYQTIVQKRLKPVLDELYGRLATIEYIEKNFELIHAEYVARIKDDSVTSTYFGHQEKHKLFSCFFAALSDEEFVKLASVEDNKKDRDNLPQHISTKFSALLLAHNDFTKEFSNSKRLLGLVDDTMNMQPNTNIPLSIQAANLAHLLAIITKLKLNTKALDHLKQFYFKDKDPIAELTKIENILDTEYTEIKNRISGKISDSYSSSALRFCLGLAAGNALSLMFPILSSGMLVKGASVVAYYRWGLDIQSYCELFGGFLHSQVVGNIAKMLAVVFEPVNTAVGYAAGGAIGAAAQIANKGLLLTGLKQKPLSQSDLYVDQRLLNTIYETNPDKRKILLRVAHINPEIIKACELNADSEASKKPKPK